MHRLGALAALVLFADYTHNLELPAHRELPALGSGVIIGLFIVHGPYLFGAMALEAWTSCRLGVTESGASSARSRHHGRHCQADYSKQSTC